MDPTQQAMIAAESGFPAKGVGEKQPRAASQKKGYGQEGHEHRALALHGAKVGVMGRRGQRTMAYLI